MTTKSLSIIVVAALTKDAVNGKTLRRIQTISFWKTQKLHRIREGVVVKGTVRMK